MSDDAIDLGLPGRDVHVECGQEAYFLAGRGSRAESALTGRHYY